MSDSDNDASANNTFALALAFLRDCSYISEPVRAILTSQCIAHDFRPLAECCGLVRAADDPDAWLELRQVEALFKKNASFVDSAAATLNAARSFVQSELQCSATNDRLTHALGNPDAAEIDGITSTRILTMRRAITHLLGDFDEFESTIPQRIRLTAGATQDRSRSRALPFLKVTRRLRAPRAAWILIGDTLRRLGFDESIFETRYVDTDENRVGFVDKNFRTKRTIACEGTHVVPLQLAFDSFAKEKLKSVWSVDLTSQSRSQELARLGSIDGSYSTVDLERASDTVAYLLIWLLFPRKWAVFLCSLRAPRWFTRDKVAMTVMGSSGSYAKFSSMGNGTTFCIETIIFAASCIAVGSESFAVYGDDIAIERPSCGPLLDLLAFLGFVPNCTKTFHWAYGDGFFPFRESCGADWFRGRRVTPFYLRKEPSSYSDFHLAINGMVDRSVPLGAVWYLCRMWIGEQVSHFVPVNEDPRSGVFVDTPTAYNLGIVKTASYKTPWGRFKDHIPFFWGLGRSSPEIRCSTGLRSYLAWFLDGRSPGSAPADGVWHAMVRNGVLSSQIKTWLSCSSAATERDPRITSLVSDELSAEFESQQTRFVFRPVNRPPCHIHMWTDFIVGRQPAYSKRKIPWDRYTSL